MQHERKYFPRAAGEAALKARYKALAKALHPDKSGLSSEAFNQMRKEYEDVTNMCSSDCTQESLHSRISTETALNIMDFCCAASERWPLMQGLNVIAQHILKNQVRENVIVVRPTLEDLLVPNVVQIEHGGEIFVVPAWHRCMVYDFDLVIVSEPDLPQGVTLDNAGNINVSLYTASDDIVSGFLTDGETVAAGTSLVLRNRGVPISDTSDIFNVERRMHVLLHA